MDDKGYSLEDQIQKERQRKAEEFPSIDEIIQQEQREFGDVFGFHPHQLYLNYHSRPKRRQSL